MVNKKKKLLLEEKQELFATNIAAELKEGIPIEKGVVIGEDFLIENEELFKQYFDFFISYPDCFLDLISNEDCPFTLFFYQRIMLRAMMRYKEVYVTAGRATSKTFLAILAMLLQCIFIPGRKVFIVATFKTQAAKIAKQKLEEIFNAWPILKREFNGWELNTYPGNYGKDYVSLTTPTGSTFDVVGGDGTRGLRRHGGILEELRDADEEEITEIVLPLLNVARRMPDGTVNPDEPNSQKIAITSAGVRSSFAYNMLLDTFGNSIINPHDSFCIGMDYRIPMLHGLTNKKFINDLKMSPAFNEASFATEYLSLWRGSSADSWFDFEKMTKYRKLKNPETRRRPERLGSDGYYTFAVDVGRLRDQSEVFIFRVNPIKDIHYASVVNIITLGLTPETRQFSTQARDLKELIELYSPKEVLIDTNGLGIGLADEMIKPHVAKDGHYLPPYGFFNNDDYIKIQPKEAITILYSMKANGPLNSKIHGNAYSRISSGKVRFLITEQEAKSSLLATKKGQKMTVLERQQRLLPHDQTTKLFHQMTNLRLKATGNVVDIVLERINARYPKDKFSALEYGLWRIKELEEAAFSRRRRTTGKRQLTFFTGGN